MIRNQYQTIGKLCFEPSVLGQFHLASHTRVTTDTYNGGTEPLGDGIAHDTEELFRDSHI